MDGRIPGVHEISGPSRAFLIDGDEGVTLVDTGMPKRDGAVLEALQKIGRAPQDLRAILITHSHSDHVGSAAVVKQRSGAALFASPGEAAAIRGEEPTTPPPMFDRFSFLRPLFRFVPSAAPVEVDVEVTEASSEGLPGDLGVIDTPGHTPGHVSYLLDRAGGVLFAGDAAVANRRGAVRRGYMNASTPTFDASLRHLADHEFEIALFAHSRGIYEGAAAAFRTFARAMG